MDTRAPTDVSVAQGTSSETSGVIVGVAGGITCVTLAVTVVVVSFVLLRAKFKPKRKGVFSNFSKDILRLR